MSWLIAEKTIDEAYYWIGRRKIKAAGRMGERLNMEAGPGPEGVGSAGRAGGAQEGGGADKRGALDDYL